MLTIASGNATCTLYPELGGSLGGWTVAGQNMLRAADAVAVASGNPLNMSSFPLVPYSNRIGYGRFEWDGQTIELTRNFFPEPHAIHGIGWHCPWTITDHSPNAVTMLLSHAGDDRWPWPFAATQQLKIDDYDLTLVLRVHNLADQPRPLAFGHHPYFDAAAATLAFSADIVWMTGSDGLPTEPLVPENQFDFRNAGPVEGRNIDHCFAGVSGAARIWWADRPLALEVSSSPQMGAAVVYIPANGDAFCFEPVPHINNALNLAGHVPAMPIVAAGGSFETVITMIAIPNEYQGLGLD